MARIFVSYSRSDRQFIDQFIPLIRRIYGNDSVWFDDDIHGGVDWWQMILNEIRSCDLFIYLISNESLASPYCQAELREALRLNKQILPVIVRRLRPPYPGNIEPDLATILRKTQYVDMSGGFRDPAINASLYASINRLLDSDSPQPAAPTTSTSTPEPPVPDKGKHGTAIRVMYIAGAFALLVAIIAGIFGLTQGLFANNNNATSETLPTTAVAQILTDSPTEPAITQTAQNVSTTTLEPMPTPASTLNATKLGGGSGLIAYNRGDCSIVLFDVENDVERSELQVCENETHTFYIDWLNAGNELVLTSFNADKIYFVTLDGSIRQTMQTEQGHRYVDLSPDQNQLVSVVDGHIAFRNLDGEVERVVELDFEATYTSWSPDGARIIFRGTPASGEGLFLLDVESNEVSRLTIGHHYCPRFSPDGSNQHNLTTRHDGCGRGLVSRW